MSHQPHRLIPSDFTPWPSRGAQAEVKITKYVDPSTDTVGHAVSTDGDVPWVIGLDREGLAAAGFTGKVGETLLLPRHGEPSLLAVGVGAVGSLTVSALRNAAAAASRGAKRSRHLALDLLEAAPDLDADQATTAVVEGALLARYHYDELKTTTDHVRLARLDLLGSRESTAGALRGSQLARATALARDLAFAPPAHLTATVFGEFARSIAADFHLDVTVYDKAQLIELGCGGLLGVNAGSVEEPRMIRIQYTPTGTPTGHLGLVGKGIMYDSGGIALKPGDAMHLAMKMDMSGAAAIFAAMTTLAELGCPAAVTGYLMCTDNMPSGSATAMGDVLTIRGGTTVEVKNTDAEGRLVMADALVLATEDGVDAIVDIATLTGASLASFGLLTAALYGNNQDLIDRVREASATTDEGVWQMPLEHRYREQLNSDVADISNLGGPYAGSTTAALFLEEFVAGTPWAHIDMCGPMQSDKDELWRTKGPTGFGARLLAEFATGFRAASLR
ncbi:leucyl aminopeptidase [Klugiella xanthotipulae]|uniref:Probable cytosol aminopeptidase n=1 Tax=Klugiella xanthotipulae TaxID=244735 RepID=A0A543HGY8_9MICO|nr:leucyl aminopeptidase [Klugiella xanthotipulae]TQM57592.1 leucyl aminopeptidase [Klugiella xanthotipulae]